MIGTIIGDIAAVLFGAVCFLAGISLLHDGNVWGWIVAGIGGLAVCDSVKFIVDRSMK